jgi:hypothetical protein
MGQSFHSSKRAFIGVAGPSLAGQKKRLSRGLAWRAAVHLQNLLKSAPGGPRIQREICPN